MSDQENDRKPVRKQHRTHPHSSASMLGSSLENCVISRGFPVASLGSYAVGLTPPSLLPHSELLPCSGIRA